MSSSKRARRNRYRRNQEVTRKFVKAVARKIGVPLRVFSGDVGKSLAAYVETYWKEYERRLRAGMELLMKGWMNNPPMLTKPPDLDLSVFRPFVEGMYPTTIVNRPADPADYNRAALLPMSEWKGKPPESRPEVKPT